MRLPPLILEDEILESLSTLKAFNTYSSHFYGADKSTCSANTRLRSFQESID